MGYQTILLPHFKRQLKPLVKKHRDLPVALLKELGNFSKEAHVHLGRGIYKIRLSTKSLARRKNKGFRLIILLLEIKEWIVPITLYAKSDASNLSLKELKRSSAAGRN